MGRKKRFKRDKEEREGESSERLWGGGVKIHKRKEIWEGERGLREIQKRGQGESKNSEEKRFGTERREEKGRIERTERHK